MSNAPIHSTGRGGAGNIGPDSNVYTDGGIVREGVQGLAAEGEYSTGRGGRGNIVNSPRLAPADEAPRRTSFDYVPETALRGHQENYHTGRGGSGNVHIEKYGGHSHPPDQGNSIKDKIKHALHLDKDGKKAERPSSKEGTPKE
ncbi:uncharacterized protein EI97DRAFT_23619 [Westerdykella ornata]|uniref:Uncharacterized protein n=1 Tax=Westerdykella ornata TaxID=318751 RepID=A0A6A6JZG3_WESOR|nr:uncharacterized protein EI97DRAFT_23619 [Westerdykella ornata]KAF2281238.1 hypothetical protein EI97DRAFT_23619 [Westerdykella ornata]